MLANFASSCCFFFSSGDIKFWNGACAAALFESALEDLRAQMGLVSDCEGGDVEETVERAGQEATGAVAAVGA